jgi:hypothetical protein
MRWSKPTLPPFLDVRTAVLNGTLEDAFRHRHHGFRPANDDQRCGFRRCRPAIPRSCRSLFRHDVARLRRPAGGYVFVA